jgi:hypothetical protein
LSTLLRVGLAALTLINVVAHGGTTNTPLKFYVVSQEKVEGSKFIDTPALPRLGYIAPKPDLIITEIRKLSPAPPGDWLDVWLRPEDAKRLEAFKSKQVLVMLGDRVVRAANPLFPITGDLLQLGFENAAELKKVQDELTKLVGSP